MQYVVRHLTRFVYTAPVCESVMELRMQPLDRPGQQCLRFNVTTSQRAKIFAYRDSYGNAVHYFDVPGHHARLDVTVESTVSVSHAMPAVEHLPGDAWAEVDRAAETDGDLSDWLEPSPFARPSSALREFARAVALNRALDPLTTLRLLNRTVFEQFTYEPRTTRVDSPIDDALRARAGVCQDFAHIMTALVRGLGIPARYVSGYIAPQRESHDRSAENATHAWVEVHLPTLGWVGFDPTNDILAGERHIAVAVGRDYSDVPPTRGVFKGAAGSELSVAVAVTEAHQPVSMSDLSPTVSWITPPRAMTAHEEAQHGQQ